jgi:hypothetical protein
VTCAQPFFFFYDKSLDYFVFLYFLAVVIDSAHQKNRRVFGASISPYRRNLLPITIKPFRRSRRLFFFFALPYLPPLFSWIYTNSPFYFGLFFYNMQPNGAVLL